MTPVIEFAGVAKDVGTPPRALLRHLDLVVNPAETVALCGRSGSGKSTLLNLAGGLDTAFTGDIRVEGRSLRQLSDDERADLRVHRVAMVFQAFHLLDHLAVLANVTLPARFASGGESTEVVKRARALLDEVGLAGREHDSPRNLSGGERQRVALARALVMQPALLLADEPTGNLDPATATQVLDMLQRLVAEHRTAVLLVTHDRAVAARANRVAWMKDGALVGGETP